MCARGRVVTSRLGLRVFALLAVLNLAVFSALGVFLTERLEEQRAELVTDFREQIVSTLESTIIAGGGLNVARIIDWPGWSQVSDAVLVDANLERTPSGRIVPRGVALHPVGQVGPRADREAIFEGLAACVADIGRRQVAGGFAVPIVSDGELWGALWYRERDDATRSDLAVLLWSGFALSTVLLMAGTFVALRPLVILPIGRLAGAAQRVARGDLTARVRTSGGNDEVSAVLASFNRMAERVERLTNDLEEEVQTAVEQARRAEAAVIVQRRLAAMGELAAGIAHEINNPLGGLQNAVRALEKGDLPDERRERYLALLDSGLERIRDTVSKVLRMAPRETAIERVDLFDVVRDAAGLVRHRVGRDGHRLLVSVDGVATDVEAGRGDAGRGDGSGDDRDATNERFCVLGARQELAQALLNLLVNAFDALDEALDRTGRPGRVLVALERRGAEIVLRVEDDGPGAAREDLDRLTDLFFSTKEVGKGTGMGLSIVQNTLDTHGGRLELESAPGAGFKALCILPGATR